MKTWEVLAWVHPKEGDDWALKRTYREQDGWTRTDVEHNIRRYLTRKSEINTDYKIKETQEGPSQGPTTTEDNDGQQVHGV